MKRSNAARQEAWEEKKLRRRAQDPTHAPIVKQRIATKKREANQLSQAREACKARAGGRCEANWPGVCPDGPHRGHHAHHVWLKSQGGPDELWNLLYVCRTVHWHAHNIDRAGAEERGIIARGSERRSRLSAPADPKPRWSGDAG
jgi:hypothetical protein